MKIKKLLCLCIVLMLAVGLVSCGQSADKKIIQNGDIVQYELKDIQLTTEYQTMKYKNKEKFSPNGLSYINVVVADSSDSASLHYNLVVYDSNNNRQNSFTDVEMNRLNQEGILSCKVDPNGYFTLEVKCSSAENVSTREDGTVDILLY